MLFEIFVDWKYALNNLCMMIDFVVPLGTKKDKSSGPECPNEWRGVNFYLGSAQIEAACFVIGASLIIMNLLKRMFCTGKSAVDCPDTWVVDNKRGGGGTPPLP